MSIWDQSAYVANPGNCPPDIVAELGLFKTLVVQIAFGKTALPVDPAWVAKCRELNLNVCGWAWCVGDDPEGEARFHSTLLQSYDGFGVNQEEAYDAHGDQSSPKWSMPRRYLGSLTCEKPLAFTTTPRFASDLRGFRERGAVYQPQAFTGEAAAKSGTGSFEELTSHFSACFKFAWDSGWPISQIRPLIQAYATNDVRVDPAALSVEAALAGLGGTPYTVEQALDSQGIDWLRAVASVIKRPQPAQAPKPVPPPKPPTGGGNVSSPLPFDHALKLGSHGLDVSGAKRAVYRFLKDAAKWKGYIGQTSAVKQTFGPFFRQDLIHAQRLLTAGTKEGVFDRSTLRALEFAGAFDWTARHLWILGQTPKKDPVLIEPNQGFHSLAQPLWADFSLGRSMGLTDLGTYNPNDPLPSGGKSDHQYYPAWAFDLGVSPQNGYDNTIGKKFFNLMVNRPGIHYVILGDKIWSTEKGLHAYTSGGHDNHVHTSGIH